MNFADLETVWRSPHNRPTAAQLEKQKMEFLADLRRRRRGNLRFLVLSGLPLVLFTILTVRHIIAPEPDHTPVDLRREWAIIPLYTLPWIAWLYIVRLHFRQGAQHRQAGASISASVAALLDENHGERKRYKFVGTLLVLSTLVLPLIVHQLRVVGKAGDEILLPGFVLAPALLLGIALGMAVHYRRRLLPRKQELETLLATYQTAPAGRDPSA
jgi:hypothetical protein